MKTFFLIFLFAFSAQVASATTADPCHDDSNVGQTRCYQRRFRVAERQLAREYRELYDLVEHQDPAANPREAVRDLVDSERTWIAYRAANCEFDGMSDYGGTARGLETLTCLVLMTQQRVHELRRLQTLFRGDRFDVP